jgi:hypothetical protein
VEPMLPSMNLNSVPYFNFEDVENQFITVLVPELFDSLIPPSKDRPQIITQSQLTACVRIGQKTIRDAKIRNVHASIRDVVRFFNFLKYFQKLFLESYARHIKRVNEFLSDDYGERVISCVVMSFCLTYYFRMDRKHRAQLAKGFTDVFKHRKGFDFEKAVQELLKRLYDTSNLNGIAPTSSFKENLFCIVFCIDAMIPCAIVGVYLNK